jgi:glycosyltransferase involved in cell wall biosynthesis
VLLHKTPELSVCIFQESSTELFHRCLESVLQQDLVEFDVHVICSPDLELPADPRISILPKTSKRSGAAYNAVLRNSTAPFLAIVGSSDLVLPGAFRKMLDASKRSEKIGMVHCFCYPIHQQGTTTRERARDAKQESDRMTAEGFDLKRELLIRGFFISPLRVFRREAIESCGGFDTSEFGDLLTTLKLADQYQTVFVPEFLYCRRITKLPNRWQTFQLWRRRYSTLVRFRRETKLFNADWLEAKRWRTESFQHALRIDLKKIQWNWKQRFRLEPLHTWMGKAIYYRYVSWFGWWPLDWFSRPVRKHFNGRERVAYYTWHFPVFSQTFVHREMDALRKQGVQLTIVAENAENPELSDQKAQSLLRDANYLEPMDSRTLSNYLKHFFYRRPFITLNALLFILANRYSRFKSSTADWIVFTKAVYLAGILKDRVIQHIHSPWADESAMIALLASRLLGVTFSVQARAHEIHREQHQYAFRKSIVHADFLITNTRYNEQHIRTLLNSPNGNRIVQIYNGLDLAQLPPISKTTRRNPITLLSVARLIEQKGLIYLLKACRILIERGYSFRCEIVGGLEQELYMNYFVQLQTIHRQLQLSNHVFFTGRLNFEDVCKKYSEADIFVLPCVIAEDGSRDIIPNALLEAMAMQLAVVSTTITGVPEIVDDGENGLLVPPANEEALANAIGRLIDQPDLRARLGENARGKIEQTFDISKNIQEYVRLFKS